MIPTFKVPSGTAAGALGFGFKNVMANYPVLIIRIAEALIALVVSVGLTATFGFSIFLQPLSDQKFDSLTHHAPLVTLGIVAVMLLVTVIALIVDSFIAAANVRVYLEGFRAASAAMSHPPVAAFRVFGIRKWLAAGRASWWRFLRVNLITGLISLVLLAPFAVFWFPHITKPFPLIGCIGMVLLPVLVLALIRVGLWGMKAEVICIAVPEASVGESLRAGWSTLRAKYGVHLVAALIVGLTYIAVVVVLALVAHRAGVVAKPLGYLVGSLASPIAICWVLASFVALTERA